MSETPDPAGPATGANCLSPLPAPRSDALVVGWQWRYPAGTASKAR